MRCLRQQPIPNRSCDAQSDKGDNAMLSGCGPQDQAAHELIQHCSANGDKECWTAVDSFVAKRAALELHCDLEDEVSGPGWRLSACQRNTQRARSHAVPKRAIFADSMTKEGPAASSETCDPAQWKPEPVQRRNGPAWAYAAACPSPLPIIAHKNRYRHVLTLYRCVSCCCRLAEGRARRVRVRCAQRPGAVRTADDGVGRRVSAIGGV